MRILTGKLRFLIAIVSFLVLGALTAVAQQPLTAVAPQPDVKQIVDQNYPQSLIDNGKLGGGEWTRHSCFAIYDTLANGAPRTIMAGYSNDFRGAIRVIQADSAGHYGVIFEPSDLHLSGIDCTVDLQDIDGDRTPEVLISFPSVKGNTLDWLFQWNGSQLVNLGPDQIVRGVYKPGPFRNIGFLDLYHDGTQQVVDGGEYPPPYDGSLPTVPSTLYRSVGSKFVEVGPLFLGGSYERAKGAPQADTRWFQLVQGANGPYMLHLSNGGKDGKNRVSSAHVVLNGTEVVSPQQLNQKVEFLDVAITSLLPNNSLEVTLEGAPGGKIALMVTGTVSPTSP